VKRAIAWCAQNPVAANLAMVVIVAMGLGTLPTLRQELIPSLELDMISVTIAYPGSSPAEVESSITNRVEEELRGRPGFKRVRSTSSEGVSTVTVELQGGEDVRRRLDDVQQAIDGITTFPDGAEEPVIRQLEIENRVLNVAVAGDVDEWTLTALAQRVRDEIAALPNVSDARLSMARPYEISIEVSEASLRRHGLRFDDVVRAVRQSSLDLPGGAIKTDAGEILLRAKGQAYRGEDFEGIALVSRDDGTRLRLGDVATVVDGFAETDQRARFDGRPTLLVQVFRQGDQKSLEISETVQAWIDEASARMPAGVSLTIWNDESQALGDRLDSMVRNGRGGFILVVIVLAMFLRLRLALWVSLGIPISFLGAVALLPTFDISINFVSLLGFIIVLGIVVDDAIVVGENTHVHQERTGDNLRGAILGAQTIVVPVTFGVLTTIAAFAPLMTLPGPMGRMSRVMPIVVISCLLFSVLEAMFILPAHLGHGKRTEGEGSTRVSRGWRRFQARVASGLSWVIDDLYRPALERAIEWRYLTAALALSLLLFTLGLLGGGWLKFVFQQPVEADFIVADLTLSPGTPVSETARAIERLERAAYAVAAEVDAESPPDRPPVFTHVMASIGEQPMAARRQQMSTAGLRGSFSESHVGEVHVEVVGYRQRDVDVQELARRWRERAGEFPGVEELTFEASLVTVGKPIEIELSGPDLDSLRGAAADVKEHLVTYPGVFDVADSFRGGKQELEYQILPSAETLGFTLEDLARQLRQAFYGEEAQSLQRGRDEVEVWVRYPPEERRSLGDVEHMRIRSPDGREVPFESVARAELRTGFSTIRHVDGRRVVSVTADVDQSAANANEIVRTLRGGALDEVLEPWYGVQYSFEGEQAEQREFLTAMAFGYAIALLVIYSLLAVPLGSYFQPLIIMTAIPFGLVGAAWGHLLLGYVFTMYSVLGLVALSGVVVNASLVLVDYVNQRVADGVTLERAVRDAARARFRPILLTSLTTFVGLTPLMMEQSMQGKFMIPMAISIAFGVLFASAITLFLVPCSYLILEDVLSLFRRGEGPPPQPARRPVPARSRARDEAA
jgi:multidrug efflux pump subunit AcrB